MVLKLLNIVLVGLFLLNGDNFYQRNQKKTDKELSKLWEGESVKLSPLLLKADKLKSLNLKQPELYKVNVSGADKAYAYFTEAPSKFETFTYMVIFDMNLKIKYSKVLQYRENYGGEICSKRFLRQFEGKHNGQGIEFNKDIDGISGATISAKSITIGIKKVSQNIYKLRKEGLI